MIYATPRSGRIVSGAKTRRQAKLGSDVLVELEPTYPQNINWIFITRTRKNTQRAS